MKKSLIALAVAGAVAAPTAFAATANIDFGGTMSWDVTSMGSTGISNNNTQYVNNNSSVLFFRGSEDLGGGLTARFSSTYTLGSNNGNAMSATDTFVALGSKSLGEVRIGIHDPLVKLIGRRIDLFGNQVTGDARHLTNQGAIDGRYNNQVLYFSPSFSGFQVALAHAMDETKAAAGGTSNAANGGSSNQISATYSAGPLFVGLGYDKVDLVNDQKTWRLAASYTMGDLRFTGMYQDSENVAGNSAADLDIWGLGAAYKMGNITLKGQYYSLDDDRSNRDARFLSLGADYAFSKRTTAMLGYQKFKNDSLANFGGAGVVAGSDTVGIAAGADPRRVALQLRHTF